MAAHSIIEIGDRVAYRNAPGSLIGTVVKPTDVELLYAREHYADEGISLETHVIVEWPPEEQGERTSRMWANTAELETR